MVDQGGERHSEDEQRIGYRFITVRVHTQKERMIKGF